MLCLSRTAALLIALTASLPAQQPKRPAMPDNVIFEPDLEYAPAVGGKLALDIVRPRDNTRAPHPARAARLCGRYGYLSARAEVSIPRAAARCQSGRTLSPRQCR